MDGVVECEQCGRVAFPHSVCVCRDCGIRHNHSLGCRRVAFCPQCCRTTRVHGVCDCVHCHSRHQTSQLCRARPALRHFRAAMTGVTPPISNIGSMSVVCPFCAARSWPNEKISCCSAGEIQLPPSMSQNRQPCAFPGMSSGICPNICSGFRRCFHTQNAGVRS